MPIPKIIAHLATQTELTDPEILELLSKDSSMAMEVLFQRYYSFLVKTVLRLLPNGPTAEDLVQEVFLELWRKRAHLQIKTSLKAYLRRAAVNKSLNYLRDQRLQIAPQAEDFEYRETTAGAVEKLESAELQRLINDTIEKLPERCRLVFCLSRFEDMTYQEIADQLDISLKTVENQISKALKILKQALGPYLQSGLLGALILMLFG